MYAQVVWFHINTNYYTSKSVLLQQTLKQTLRGLPGGEEVGGSLWNMHHLPWGTCVCLWALCKSKADGGRTAAAYILKAPCIVFPVHGKL